MKGLWRVLAAGIPGAQYAEFADASHGLPIQKEEAVNLMLTEFIRGARSPGRSLSGL